MEKNTPHYNEIFDKLVGNEVSVIGLIAYGLYKRSKRKRILDYIELHGKRPTPKVMSEFVTTAMGQLDLYKNEANNIFMKAVGKAVREELVQNQEKNKFVDSILQEAKTELGKVENNYQEAVKEIIHKRTYSFWGTVGVNIISALLLPFVIYFIIMAISLKYPNFPDQIKAILRSFV
ncbi:MAG: hypothetical protein IJV09_00180 [Prevotella sp.]|nr:hypothetical protein [Prevotella sp.]